MVTWRYYGRESYIVQVTPLDGDGGRCTFLVRKYTASFLVKSATVGGYRRVSIRVTEFNDAGYGPYSNAMVGWMPPTGVCTGRRGGWE